MSQRTDELLQFTDRGIYCPDGDFHIDPWKPVARAVITHGHSDHARSGHDHYLAHRLTAPILRLRLGQHLSIESLEYGVPLRVGRVTVTLFPAGHVPGSAQVLIERGGERWVAGGDYKTRSDGLSTPWEPVQCHAFITESTFGLPIYKWPDPTSVADEIRKWWQSNRETDRTSVVTAYSLGKAQRILHMLGPVADEIFVHPSIAAVNSAYRDAGLQFRDFPSWHGVSKERLRGAMLVMPPAAVGEKRSGIFASASFAHASGWMAVRGNKRRLALDRGFVVSDHADWTELNLAVRATGAERIFVTHGQIDPFVRWLREQGRDAHPVQTRFVGETADEPATPPEDAR